MLSRPLASTRCLVTGGLGFIGSNLVHELHRQGAVVTVVDGLVDGHGGHHGNLDGVTVPVTVADISDPAVGDLVADADVIFNVAGQVSHTASMRDPLADLRLNATSHASFLETIRHRNPMARVVHTSTRQVYGRALRQPVDELHPAHPVDVNGVAKLAGEQLHMVYAHAHEMPITSLRLTNVYGPRQRLTSDELGFLPVFLRKALNNETIRIFGDGQQRRDCLYVDDVVEALIACTADVAVGSVYNVGHVVDNSLVEVASEIVSATASTGGVEMVAWPDEHLRIDIGSFHTDGSKIADTVGWKSSTTLSDGVARTVAFYREHPWYLSST